jgi:tetratricopeptide (TPR) repeat protein
MGRDWSRAAYRPGDAEGTRARDLFYRGELTEVFLAQAEALARGGRNRSVTRHLYTLRGEWYLARDEPARAVASLTEAVRMAREVGGEVAHPEALLALARLRAGERFDAVGEGERLGKAGDEAALAVAELWRELGDRDRAIEHALRAHRWAVADGEPYVHRYELDRTRALLTEHGAELPEVPRHAPATVKPFPWEKDVRAFIDKLRAEREAKEAEGEDDDGEE